MSRFYRSTRDAFPAERYPAVFGPYRQPGRWLLPLGYFCLFGLFALMGVLLAIRG